MSSKNGAPDFMTPLRAEIVGQARGVVLEIGAGAGLNFAWYDPAVVERVEAIEPSGARRRLAATQAASARVPVHLTDVRVERLPFADESFDSAVATTVFCSVDDPLRGLLEVRRVLKPASSLLLVEHVRAKGALVAALQTIAIPLTRLVDGNCRANRDTVRMVQQAGFSIAQRRDLVWWVIPYVVLRAVK